MREKKLQLKKKVAIGGGIFAGITTVATILGLISDSISLFSKDKKNDTVSAVYVAEQEEESIIISTEEVAIPVNPENFYLHNIDPIQTGGYFKNSNSEKDTVGNLYSGNLQNINKAGYAIYYIAGKYSSLKGTIAANNKHFSNDETATITILVDDEEVYKTEKFGRVSAPMDIDIDISGGEWLKIQHAGTNEHRTQVILAN
ncbi:MAG: NPCBM/NEW2 domain-containing protein, partial [Oscillospiraceae bacterium]|nr:NPCBM/NEW2 domain-containing protein [Oscillospiraceae bacterium]